ncbi:MAG: radical SAM protein, partial [Oscillospiraceae bacterium]|nr:radical SAM protein [Oscillospiraceae bacterium]
MIRLLLIQPENRRINRFRRLQFNNFSQITIPYLAAFADERYFEITLVDEYCGRLPYNRAFDLVAITVNTPNAP